MIIPRDTVTEAWNQIEEVRTDFEQCTDEELINLKETIKWRLERALFLLGNYVKDQG